MSDKQKLSREIEKQAGILGIDHIGICTVEEAERFVSPSPREYLPQVKTVIAAALSYNYSWNSLPADSPGYIARYTTANFYNILYKKLKSLARFIKEKSGTTLSNRELYKIFVNSRLDDKGAAYAAGLGSLLTNSLLAVKGEGPRFVLGELLLTIELPAPEPAPAERTLHRACPACGKCCEHCPTGAIREEGRVEKSLCLQHLSSQLHWEPDHFCRVIAPHWGERFFGCTTCVDVCPLNRTAPLKEQEEELIGFIGTTFEAEELFTLRREDYNERFGKNQLSANWISPAALARNGLFMLYKQDKKERVSEYLTLMAELGWTKDELDELRFFCKYCLNL